MQSGVAEREQHGYTGLSKMQQKSEKYFQYYLVD